MEGCLCIEELNTENETEYVDSGTGIQKQPAFTKYNPN